MTPISLRYRSARREVWTFYWWCWRQPQGLWRIHAFYGGLLAAVALSHAFGAPLRTSLPLALVAFVLPGAIMAAVPQILFKPRERTLTVDEAGLRTTIGKMSGEQSWDQVMTILALDDLIAIVGKNLKGFIVPRRAFASDAERTEFLETLRRRHAGDGYDIRRSNAAALFAPSRAKRR